MSCLFRRSNGFWYIVHREQGRQRWLSTGTQCFGKASIIFRSRPSCRDGRHPATISDFASEFDTLASSDHSKGTRSLYAHSFRSLIHCIGDKPIKFVTVKDVEEFKTDRIKTVSPVTVNVEFRTLKAAFNVAVRWGMISENVFVKSRQLRIPIREPAYLTREEFGNLLSVVDDPDFCDLLEFAVSTMLRRGELVNLEWGDIDFPRKLIHVRNKEHFRVKANRPRVVPMSETVYRLLLKRKQPTGFVFGGKGGIRFSGGYISKKFKRYARKCGVSEAVHFHSLRHTGATWLIQQDVPLYAVQKLLGHSSPAVTQIYSHLSDENLRRVIEQLSTSAEAIGLN